MLKLRDRPDDERIYTCVCAGLCAQCGRELYDGEEVYRFRLFGRVFDLCEECVDDAKHDLEKEEFGDG